MADASSPLPRPFDVQTIKDLVRLMSRHDLSEIDLREGELRIRLLRGGREVALPIPTPPLAATPVAPPATAVDSAKPADAPKPAKHLIEIKSPGPGTFYVAPNPDSEPYVRIGSKVTPTTVIGLLEAMKLFTEINAECSGVVTEIVIENQHPVEYGQVLFRVDPTG